MKKSPTYIVVAVLLGAGLMLAPYLAFPPPTEMETYGKQPSPRKLSPENLRTWSAESEASVGVTPHYPMDAISVSLMLTISLIFALIVSSQVKKRGA